MKAQSVGAYGEKAVEAELLRNYWAPANVNHTIKNAADYDIFAVKEGASVQIRVKTCGPRVRAFQYRFPARAPIKTKGLPKSDFTVLVSMGVNRTEDEFYIVPTVIVRKALNGHREFYLRHSKRDGSARKDNQHWGLWLNSRKVDNGDPGHGVAKRWANYRNNWQILER